MNAWLRRQRAVMNLLLKARECLQCFNNMPDDVFYDSNGYPSAYACAVLCDAFDYAATARDLDRRVS